MSKIKDALGDLAMISDYDLYGDDMKLTKEGLQKKCGFTIEANGNPIIKWLPVKREPAIENEVKIKVKKELAITS